MERIEVDMIHFAGPAFATVDDRLMALELVRQDLTEAAMFTADGRAVQWAELLHRKPVLIQRGSFRPVTEASLDVLDRSLEQFLREPELQGETPVVLAEMTLRHLTAGDAIDDEDFLHRADTLCVLGNRTVLISNFGDSTTAWRRTFRATRIAHWPGDGGIEARGNFRREFLQRELGLRAARTPLQKQRAADVYPSLNLTTGHLMTAENFPIASNVSHLYAHLRENHSIQDIENYNPDFLLIRSRDVLARLQSGDSSWEAMTPAPVANAIKAQHLFGLKPGE